MKYSQIQRSKKEYKREMYFFSIYFQSTFGLLRYYKIKVKNHFPIDLQPTSQLTHSTQSLSGGFAGLNFCLH